MNIINNAKRYKTISEMDHKEVWYISSHALCFDFNDQWQELRALFHYKPYSKTKYISDYDIWENFDVLIKCTIKSGVKNYQIKNSIHNIIYKNLANISVKEYIILSTQEKIINIFDANQDNIDDEELDWEFFDFIESILEQDDENDKLDEVYWDARNNFSDAILSYCNKDNRKEIENILYNLVIYCDNDIQRKTVLNNLYDQSKCKKYLISLSKERVEGFIDSEMISRIESISGVFYETFIKSEISTKNNTKSKKEDQNIEINKLKIELEKAIEGEEYEQAEKLKQKIEELEQNNK